MRVAANSVDGKPHPASSVLKLKGSVLQQQVSELVLDLAGPGRPGQRRERATATSPSGSGSPARSS